MGFFSSLTKKVKSVAVKALDLNAAAFSNPLTFIKSPTAAVEKFKSQSKKERAVRIVGTTAVAAGAILTGGTSLGRTAAVTAAKKSVPAVGKTLFGSPGRAATTVLAAGVLTSSPTARKAAVALPKTVFNTGTTVGKAIEKSPNKEKLGEIAAKTALIGAGAGVVAAGALLIPKVAGAVKEKIKKGETPVLVNGQQVGTVASTAPVPTTIPAKTTGQVGTATKKRKRRAKPAMIKNTVKLINNNNIAIAR